MPQATNIIVNDGTTPTPVSKTFTLVTPAAGDGGIAMWALKEGAISAIFPVLTASAVKTSNRSRKLTVKLRVPSSYTDAVTGQTMVSTAAEMNVTFSVPETFPESLKPNFVAFAINTLSSTLMKEMIRDAYPAT